MEIEWEDRGQIGMMAHPNSAHWYTWERLEKHEHEWWNRVFDACRKAETRTIPGGKTILVIGG